MWKVVERCLTAALTLATIYLAYSASDSADAARESAKTASTSAAATREIAEIVKGVADSAERSVETTRKWFELSQRPFVYPAVWQVAIVDRNSRRARVVVQLTDSAEVPATVQKVCIWQDRVLIDYDRRPYEDVTVRERSVVFGPVHYNVNFRDIVLPEQQDQGVRMHLSLVYTFARDGAEQRYTWRMDTVAELAGSTSGVVSLQTFATVVRTIDDEPC